LDANFLEVLSNTRVLGNAVKFSNSCAAVTYHKAPPNMGSGKANL